MENKYCNCYGYAFIPIQEFSYTNDPLKALKRGSLFPELDLPIEDYGKVCKEMEGYL